MERNDLFFNECIVNEIHIGKKTFLHCYIYKSQRHGRFTFISKLYAMFLIGIVEFNSHYQNWWHDGNTNNEGIAIDNLLATPDLNQILCEPICEPIVECDHPLIHSANIKLHIATGTLASCHHHHHTREKFGIIIVRTHNLSKELYQSSHGHEHLNNYDPNWQIEIFNNTILNIL